MINHRRWAVGLALSVTSAAVAVTVPAQSASALMCMADCFDWDGGWQGGGGLSGLDNPNIGAGPGGSDGGRVGGGGYEGFSPDRYAPSGTGWGDSRLNWEEEEPGTGGSGDAGTYQPGTGCHPDSTDFRDIDNWRTAEVAVHVFEDWGRSGEVRVVIIAPEHPGDEYRVQGIELTVDGVVTDWISLPTTLECYNRAWTQ